MAKNKKKIELLRIYIYPTYRGVRGIRWSKLAEVRRVERRPVTKHWPHPITRKPLQPILNSNPNTRQKRRRCLRGSGKYTFAYTKVQSEVSRTTPRGTKLTRKNWQVGLWTSWTRQRQVKVIVVVGRGLLLLGNPIIWSWVFGIH